MSCSESSSVNLPAYKNMPQVRILKFRPAPEEWVLVRERNMEGREPCEVSYYSHCYSHCSSSVLYTRTHYMYVHVYVDLEVWDE